MLPDEKVSMHNALQVIYSLLCVSAKAFELHRIQRIKMYPKNIFGGTSAHITDLLEEIILSSRTSWL